MDQRKVYLTKALPLKGQSNQGAKAHLFQTTNLIAKTIKTTIANNLIETIEIKKMS